LALRDIGASHSNSSVHLPQHRVCNRTLHIPLVATAPLAAWKGWLKHAISTFARTISTTFATPFQPPLPHHFNHLCLDEALILDEDGHVFFAPPGFKLKWQRLLRLKTSLTQFDPQILISDVYDGKIKY
jgi:hypothetical protein